MGAELKEQLSLQKEKVQKKSDEVKLKVLQKDLNKTMLARAEQIEELRSQIREAKQAAKNHDHFDDLKSIDEEQASLKNLTGRETVNQRTQRLISRREYKVIEGEIKSANKNWNLAHVQKASIAELESRFPDIASSEGTTNGSPSQIKTAQARLAAAQARDDGAPTAEMRDKLEHLRVEQAYDEEVKAQYEGGIIQTDDAKLLSSKAPLKRLQGIVDVAKRQIDLASRAGAKDQERSAQSIGKLLNAMVDTTRLSTEDKNSLEAHFRSTSLAKLAVELPKVQEAIISLLAKRRHQAAVADLNALLKQINPKKNQTSKTPGSEEALLVIKEFALDEEAGKRFELNLEEKEHLTLVDEQKLELVSLFEAAPNNEEKSIQGIQRLSAQAIEKIIHTIVELRETGKAEALKRYSEKQERQAKNLQVLWKAMTETPSGKQHSKEHVANVITRTMELNPLRAAYRSWTGLMYLITQRGTLSDLREIFDLKVANAKAWGVNHEWRNRFKELVNEHGVTNREYARAFNRGEKKVKLTYAKINVETDEVKSVPLINPATGDNYSRWELVQIYNYLRDADPDAISRLSQGNGFSYPGSVPRGLSTAEAIETHLSRTAPEMLKIADAMRQFYKEFGTVVDDTVFERWGRHIETNDTYGGPLHSGASLDALTRESFRRMTGRPKSMLERTGGTQRVEIRNAMDVLDQHVASFAREHAFIRFEQDSQALFGNLEVRDFITRNFGKTTMEILDKYIGDIINGPRDVENTISRAVSFFRSKAFTYYLGGRPDQYIKQLTGMVHAFQVNSPKEVIEGWSYLFANPKESIELMNKSPLLKNRKQLLDPDFKPAKPGDLNNISQLFMKGVEAGDVAAVYGSSFPALLAELRKTGSEELALAAFDRAFETTQGSHAIDEQPHLFRSGSLAKMLSIFTQQANRQSEMISVEWDKFVNKPSPKAFVEWANTVTVSYIGAALYPLVGWILAAPFMDEKKAEKRLEEILVIAPLGPYASLPVFGLFLAPMMTGTFNILFDTKLNASTPKSLTTDILGDFVKDGHALLRLGSGNSENVWGAILASAAVLGRITGVPLPNLLKLASPFVDSNK